MNRWTARLASALLALAPLPACAPRLPVAPPAPAADDFPAAERVAPEGLADDPPEGFVLLPGDVVRLRTFGLDAGDPVDLIVDPRGVVHVPLFGDVEVGGRGLADAERLVEAQVRRLDRFTRVGLSAVDLAGHRVSIVGAVERPGSHGLKGGERLADALALAGGPRVAVGPVDLVELADLDAGRVVRGGVALPVSLGAALRGEPRHNVRLHAGDIVWIPSTSGRTITVLGFVGNAQVLPYHRGMRLTEALARAGGVKKEGDGRDVRVIRGSLAAPRVFRASLTDVTDGKAPDVGLAPGDVIYVSEHWFASVTDVIARLTPVLAAAAVGAAIVK